MWDSTSLLLGLVVLVLTAWRLTYTAARLDRLHARVEGSLASLDAQLVRRAEAALELSRGMGGSEISTRLAEVAQVSLRLGEDAQIVGEIQEHGIPHVRADVESHVTRVLAELAGVERGAPVVPADHELLRRRLRDACLRVELARRFHNEAVRDVRRVRAIWFVRLFHLAGHTALPSEITFDDRVAGWDVMDPSRKG